MDADPVAVTPVDREVRKRAELSAKLSSVRDEVVRWRMSVGQDKALRKHSSQVERVGRELQPVIELVQREVDRSEIGRMWPVLEQQVLDLHRVWGFYRDKLVLRKLEFAGYLLLADEFAWACYEPAQRAALAAGGMALAQVREPPLVYLSAVASPFSLSRGSSIADEVGDELLSTRAARALVARLPVPVIGLPWFQLHHLPDALIVGHEVGHLVLEEFVGPAVVQDLADAALGANTAAARRWRPWGEESFADVYATLCGGAAYVRTLADFLLVTGTEREQVQPDYPPAATRIALAEAVLDVVGCADAADRLRAERRQEGTPAADPGQAEEAVIVARALVQGPYHAFRPRGHDEGLALTSVISCNRQDAAPSQADDVLQGWEPNTLDIRTLLAVACFAFSADPEAYAHRGVADRILARAALIQEPGTRYRAGSDWGRAGEILTPVDEARVTDLYDLLTRSSCRSGGPT